MNFRQNCILLGASIMKGISKKTGNPYDLTRIYVAVPSGDSNESAGFQVYEFFHGSSSNFQGIKSRGFPSNIECEFKIVEDYTTKKPTLELVNFSYLKPTAS